MCARAHPWVSRHLAASTVIWSRPHQAQILESAGGQLGASFGSFHESSPERTETKRNGHPQLRSEIGPRRGNQTESCTSHGKTDLLGEDVARRVGRRANWSAVRRDSETLAASVYSGTPETHTYPVPPRPGGATARSTSSRHAGGADSCPNRSPEILCQSGSRRDRAFGAKFRIIIRVRSWAQICATDRHRISSRRSAPVAPNFAQIETTSAHA